ncbi:MAG: hypothetical protein LBH54_00790 [Clostridiales bacterium]|jgi:hypothetical protein|nr:hypothetical protein [Clostridiales bacterium]
MMKRTAFHALRLMTVTAIALSVLCGCGSRSAEIENLLSKFETSCNALNIDDMLSCVNPSVSDPIKLGLGVYNMFAQGVSDEVLDKISGALSGDSQLKGNEFFSSVKIDVKKINARSKDAVAEVQISYTLLGQTFQKEARFNCVYVSDQWYIGGFRFR